MSDRTFLDTNVLVSLFDTAEPEKQARAREVIADDTLIPVVSTQVLGEFYVVVTRKLMHPLEPADAASAVADFSRFFVVATDATMVSNAIEISRRRQLSYWDAMIVEAAREARCTRIMTEYPASGPTIDGIRIENPFASTVST